ncbi:MAG: hypothetical protein JO316_16175 [Abitibacteriaceae bacterium]|nr:hypothetical protein [Abditibacteriaceae bacterium]MBV9866890.1 hypothetical protein [Abditibacteriaceae bacterium]
MALPAVLGWLLTWQQLPRAAAYHEILQLYDSPLYLTGAEGPCECLPYPGNLHVQYNDIKRSHTIHSFRFMGHTAIVVIEYRERLGTIQPRTGKPLTLEANDLEEDTWVKDAQGHWVRQACKPRRGHHWINGQEPLNMA